MRRARPQHKTTPRSTRPVSAPRSAACAPNVAIQEMSLGIHYNVGADLFTYCSRKEQLTPHEGYLAIPTGHGLGVDIDEDVVRKAHKEAHRWRNPIWRQADGSFAEW